MDLFRFCIPPFHLPWAYLPFQNFFLSQHYGLWSHLSPTSLIFIFSPEALFHFQIMSIFLRLLVLFLWWKVANNISWVYAFDRCLLSTCCVLDPVMILVVAYVSDLYTWGTIRIFNVAHKIFCVGFLKRYIYGSICSTCWKVSVSKCEVCNCLLLVPELSLCLGV